MNIGQQASAFVRDLVTARPTPAPEAAEGVLNRATPYLPRVAGVLGTLPWPGEGNTNVPPGLRQRKIAPPMPHGVTMPTMGKRP
jgi:hypothetical protein